MARLVECFPCLLADMDIMVVMFELLTLLRHACEELHFAQVLFAGHFRKRLDILLAVHSDLPFQIRTSKYQSRTTGRRASQRVDIG